VRQAVEAPGDVERQVDRIQLDMGQRVNQRRASLKGADWPLGELRRRHQQRPGGAAGEFFGQQAVTIGRGELQIPPDWHDGLDGRALLAWIADQQGVEGELAQVQRVPCAIVDCGAAMKP